MGKKRKQRQELERLEREQNDRLRAQVGAKFGDGIELLKKMRDRNPELYALYKNMPTDRADAIVSLYASNPLMRLLITGVPDTTNVTPFTRKKG